MGLCRLGRYVSVVSINLVPNWYVRVWYTLPSKPIRHTWHPQTTPLPSGGPLLTMLGVYSYSDHSECSLSILTNAYSTRSSRVSIDLLLDDDRNASLYLAESRMSRLTNTLIDWPTWTGTQTHQELNFWTSRSLRRRRHENEQESLIWEVMQVIAHCCE